MTTDQPVDLTALGEELLATAAQATSGRAARTVRGGHEHALRQTLLGLTAGHGLPDHDSPGEATLHVLRGRVRLVAGDDSWECVAGGFVEIPPVRHQLDALEDSVALLTIALPHSPAP